MDRWKGKVAVITGASAGIGVVIVKQLIEEGLQVVGLARRKERLDQIKEELQGKSSNFYPLQADITKEDDILAAFEWIKNNLGPIHILINNAGITRSTTLIEGDSKLWKEVLDTNVLGLCIATREAVKNMRTNNINGHVIHINSVFGHKVGGFPNANVYPASKHAVTALTETLRQELNTMKSKIKITSISPGLVNTEIFEATAVGSGKPELLQEMEKHLKALPMLQSEDIACAVLYVLGTPPHVQIHELIIKPIGEMF